MTVYYGYVFVESRRPVDHTISTENSLKYVVLISALNEEKVIGATIAGMLAMGENVHIVAVDDGSDDRTADVIEDLACDRLHFLQRKLPNARKGKGQALNEWFPGIAAEHIIIGVTDADCLYKAGSLDQITRAFNSNPAYAGVQAAVTIAGAEQNLWLLLQDLEFMGFFALTQRARHWLGNVGMGGNGQFLRLSALMDLGERPWSQRLTEDFDISMNLVAKGHRLAFCPQACVVQQGLTNVRRLVRQRARWLQGHYQVWHRIPQLLKANIRLSTKLDSILSLVLIVSPLIVLADYSAGFLSWLGWIKPHSYVLNAIGAISPHLVPVYVVSLAFAIQGMMMVEYAYQRPGIVTWYTAPGLAVVSAVYASCLWVLATFMAFGRALRRNSSWDKTERETLSA
jgi:1,2-diacylglycerol 3-beta-glucosyltransferase